MSKQFEKSSHLRIYNSEELQKDVLYELENINKYTFEKIQKLKVDGLNTITQLDELIMVCQYVERKAIKMRILINRYSHTLDAITDEKLTRFEKNQPKFAP